MGKYDLERKRFLYQRSEPKKVTPAKVSAPAHPSPVSTNWRCRECGAEYDAEQPCDACGVTAQLFDKAGRSFVDVEVAPEKPPESPPAAPPLPPEPTRAKPSPQPTPTSVRRATLVREGNPLADGGHIRDAISRFRAVEKLDRAALASSGRTPKSLDHLATSLTCLLAHLYREGRRPEALALLPEILELRHEIQALESRAANRGPN
jgi:hypothetical protein